MMRAQLRQPIGDGDDLVDLLLVLDDGELHLGVLEHVGHLVGDRVLVDRDGDAAEALHGGEGRVEARTVVADDGHRVAALEARACAGRRRRRAPRRAAAPRSRSARCRNPCGAWPAGSACCGALRSSSFGTVSSTWPSVAGATRGAHSLVSSHSARAA